jgi:hypothetical protein
VVRFVQDDKTADEVIDHPLSGWPEVAP